MKKIIYSLIIFLSIVIIPNAKAIDKNDKIYDYADKLTDVEEEQIKEKIDDFIAKYKMDMVLVTVNEHNNYSTEEYADDFYDYNGFGVGKTHDGIIFVIDYNFEKENMWMSTTGEAIRMYDDERINNILDVVYEDYDYYELFSDFVDECSHYASLGIPYSNKHTYINSKGELVYERSFPWFISLGISAIVSTIVLLVLVAKNKMVKKATEANAYMNKESTNITDRSDKFITTHTTSVRINTDTGSSGRIGGSSTHHGSSGISHGGGGRSR